MSPDNLILALVVAYFAWRVFMIVRIRRELPGLLAEGAQVVDVRSPGEFASGHYEGSVNIPFDEIAQRAAELDRNRWVVVCCASGTRSAMARRRLRGLGFARVLNAGSWRSLPG